LASGVLAGSRVGLEAEFLSHFLEHNDSRVRANTVKAISQTVGDKRKFLEPMLKDPVLRVQCEAVKALSDLIPGNQIEELVLKRVTSPEAKVRAGLAYYVADLPFSRKTGILVKLLKDSDKAVVACSARSLARINDPLGWRALAELYFSAVFPELSTSIRSLFKNAPISAILVQAEKFGQPGTSPKNVIIMVLEIALDSQQLENLIPWILGGLERPECEVRLQALQVIKKHISFFGTNIEEILRKFDTSNVPEERAIAAQLRFRGGNFNGLEILRGMLHDSLPAVRAAAAKVLKEEPGLLARRVLFEAARKGIAEAKLEDTAISVTKTLNLPG